MSVKAMAAVWDADLPRPEKFVLLALADHADHEGGNIYPSLGRIGWKTGYSYQKIISIVKSLRESGVLVQTGMDRNNVVIYRIQFEQLIQLAPYQNKHNLRGKESIPLDNSEGVKKRDPSGGIETRPLDEGVSKVDPLSGKESRPLGAQGVKKLDPGGKETRYKPLSFKLVNIIKGTPEEKLITSYLSEALQKIGVTEIVSKRLLENHELQNISDWLELFGQASELKIARGAGWLVSALDHGWSLDAMQQRLVEEQAKQTKLITQPNIPDEILNHLPDIGWVGNVEELEFAYQKDPTNFGQWLDYIRKETPNDKYQSGRFLEGLRSGLPAPELISGRYQAYLANEKYSNEDDEQQEDGAACRYTDCWHATLNSMGIASHLMNCDIVDHKESGDQLILKMKANDQQSYYNLQNLKTMKNFHNKAAMVFDRAVELEIEEYMNV